MERPPVRLDHDPPTDEEDPSITFLSGDIRTAVATAQEAAGAKNVLIFGGNMADQTLAAGLVSDVLIFLLPVLLGDGVPLFDAGTAGRIELDPVRIERSGRVAILQYRVGG